MNIKVLAEFGEPQNKSLLISLPQKLINELDIDANDEVNMAQLLKVLEKAYAEKNDALSLEAHIDLMDMIFNEDRAVDERKTKD